MKATPLKRIAWMCLALIILNVFALPARARFSEKKGWRDWTKADCEKMLTDSPWARKFSTATVVIEPSGMASGGVPEREARPSIEYIAHLRSALPVRQAVIRSMQLQMKYDKMSDAEKKNFDKQADDFLGQSLADRVVVHIIYNSNVQVIQKALDDIWHFTSTDLVVPALTCLIDPSGKLVDIARYIPPGPSAPEFELLFSKDAKGSPLVKEDDRRFQVQLPGVAFYEQRILIEFDVRKMKYRGQFEY